MQSHHGRTDAAFRHVNLSVGDIIDRLTIAEIKIEHLTKAKNFDGAREVDLSRQHLSDAVLDVLVLAETDSDLGASIDDLKSTNRELWAVEDLCRDSVRYASVFVSAARNVMVLNDKRSQLKSTINQKICGSALDEVKLYGTQSGSDS